MKKHWWKILAVLILLYVFSVGMLTPLAPGIPSVAPSKAYTGNAVTVEITGYNSHYAEATNVRAWLKIDSSKVICATTITAIDNNHLNADFKIPNTVFDKTKPTKATLIVDNDIDGYSLLPDALFIGVSETEDSTNTAEWNCEITNLTANTNYDFPYRNLLGETIRNLYFHVPLWFAMIFLLLASVINSIKYLNKSDLDYDIKALVYARTGIIYGILGTISGGIWAEFTWGAFWSFDIKQNMTAIALLIYCAYLILRGSFDDMERKARISAVYNIFAFAALIPLLFVIPRMADSLHPGNGGNPAFGGEDLDNTMRTIFYPAIIGFTLLGFWISQLIIRLQRVENLFLEDDLEH